MRTYINKLTPKAHKWGLLDELNKLTAEAFGKEVPIAETEQRFDEADALFTVKCKFGLIGYGFNDILNLDGKIVNYFGSGFIHPEFQGIGLYNALNARRVTDIAADVLMTRTQNPKVVTGFTKLSQGLGYRLSANDVITSSALRIARAYDPSCDDNLVCNGVYGRELMSSTPIPEGFSAEILKNVNPVNGDGIILIGEKSL